MSAPLRLKKPKVETDTVVGATEMAHENGGDGGGVNNNNNDDSSSNREEQEEALVALIEHRTKEVEHLRKRVLYYNSQLEQAEKRLQDSESKLVRLRRSGDSVASSRNYLENGTKKVKMESQPSSSAEVAEGCSKSQPQFRPELLIPAVNPRISQPIKLADSGTKGSMASGGRASASVSRHSNSNGKLEKVQRHQEAVENQDKGTKRKLEEKEHKELIPLIRSRTSPSLIRCQTSSPISSQHKRKMRSLALCPVNDHLFVTSALDGVVNLWQIQGRGSGASILSTTDCVSPKLRRWPEDVAWHPQGDSLFFTYCADGDSQISFMNLNKTDERARVTFLEDKPHVKGIINSISFLPMDATCFVTGGSDHAVIIWKEKDGGNSWKPKALHRNLHSSAVMGVAGMQQKHIVISAGADKRIFGFDVLAERTDFKHQIESKCMSVLPNPCDFNLFMVQTATPERQLKLYDIRLRQTEIHEFGWKQERSESQSALINQAWSPDGLYITSGSADPVIHIFDIRYNARKPSQSVKAHQKRVFKAVWHFSLPLLISISSDLNIELHKIT